MVRIPLVYRIKHEQKLILKFNSSFLYSFLLQYIFILPLVWFLCMMHRELIISEIRGLMSHAWVLTKYWCWFKLLLFLFFYTKCKISNFNAKNTSWIYFLNKKYLNVWFCMKIDFECLIVAFCIYFFTFKMWFY